ncbi:MAG TPA: flippase-like domain-containing protein [Chloroflexi bacterium]|nr:flippase-like domain-containing protein [Chloroflexota bacterium]
MKGLQGKLIFGFILAFAVFIGLGIYADFRVMLRLLQGFRWMLLPVILSLTIFNYALRFSKWHYYLRQIGVKNLSWWADLRVYVGGFAFSLTPGKVGELVRLSWLKNLADVHPAKTAPVAVAERLTDGMAMVLIALLSGFIYPQYWPVLLSIGVILLGAVIVIQFRSLALWMLNLGEKILLVSKIIHHLHTLYESAYELLGWRNLLVAVGLGTTAWLSQGVAFYLVLLGLGVSPSPDMLILAIFILAFSTVAGGASGVPGGLGVTEGGLTGMLILLAALPADLAATATLLIRFCTMWLGVTLGLAVVLVWRKFLFGEQA